MKAVRLHEYDQWPTVDEVPDPEIQGPHDVVVTIGGAGVCRTDIHIWEGQWAPKTGVELPYTIGHENAGWVHEVGSAVSNVSPGDAVILHPLITCGLCLPCRFGNDMHCEQGGFPGIDMDGGWAERIRTSARSCVPLPEGVQPADVAAHADAGLTAYHAVRKALPDLYPGTTAVIIGAGGLGHIGIQSLRAMSATRIVVVDRNEEALKLSRGWGADETVVADGSHVDTVLEMTDGGGAQVVFDFVGEGGALQEGFAMTRRDGDHYVIGYGGTIETPAIDVISTERSYIGNLVGTYPDLVELMTLAGQGKVDLHTQTYPLEHAVEAMHDLHDGKVRGRAILVPEGA